MVSRKTTKTPRQLTRSTWRARWSPAAPGREPVGVVFGLADIIAGHHAALAAIGALAVRDRTGQGQHVDLAQLEAAASQLGDAVLRTKMGGDGTGAAGTASVRPLGNRHPRMSPHGVFPCLGGWVAIAARSDEEFARLAGLAGLSLGGHWVTLTDRKSHEDELERRIAAWSAALPAETVAEALQGLGVPAYPVRDGLTLVEHDAALREWGFYIPLAHPAAGTFLHEGVPVRLARTPGAVRAPAPLLGEHTEDVLTKLLGLPAAELDALRAAGALE